MSNIQSTFSIKSDEDINRVIEEIGRVKFHQLILYHNDALLEMAEVISNHLIEKNKDQQHPCEFAYGAILSAIKIAHANIHLIPKQLFLESIEAMYDSFAQQKVEEKMGLSFPEGNA